MEPAAVWVPCELQLANWTTEPIVYAPGLYVEYGSTDIFGRVVQTSALISNGQIVEYDPTEIPEQEVVSVFEGAVKDVADDAKMRREKIHRYPRSIIQAGYLHKRSTTVPMVVAIGPYHHDLDHLKKVEKMKHAAACHCIENFKPRTVQEMYNAVVAVAQDARGLYDKDVVAGMSYDDFLPMMFYDACFLVQYMSIVCATKAPKTKMRPLFDFISSNQDEIFQDIMLLENQLPWAVVHTVLELLSMQPTLQMYIKGMKGCLQDCKGKDSGQEKSFTWDDAYEPPHLLGLLRYYIVGGSKDAKRPNQPHDSLSLSVGATELAEMGITLSANRTTEVFDMGIKPKWIRFAQLCLAPLSLDDLRASCLVNMAALELCTTPNFQDAADEKSAVCSYILLLAMLVHREEDVHMLRRKHILQGGAGLTNKEVLDFFTSFKGLRLGSCYVSTMVQIQHYKSTRRRQTKVYAFLYKYRACISVAFGAIVAFVTFLVKLKSIIGYLRF